jgi:hypothetical protein
LDELAALLSEHSAQFLNQATAHRILSECKSGDGDDNEQDRSQRGHDIERYGGPAAHGSVRQVTLDCTF